jgi:hypothetical protein
MFKLRTMSCDAEATTGPVWSAREDPRTTPIGKIIRSLHLDELPQLINVMRGDMALVGPRPERPEFVELLVDEIPGYLNRLSVLPGITGLAQIHLPPDESVDCVRRKLILDLHYIETATPLVDVRVMICSLFRIMGVPGSISAHLLGFRYPYALLCPLGADPSTNGESVRHRRKAQPVQLCDLEAMLSERAHEVAAASPHLFTFREEGSALDSMNPKPR